MLLDIIIPQYSEDEEVVNKLLTSISSQKQVDFNNIKITIVNDCSEILLSNPFLESFKNLNISYIKNDKNTGPGLARQKGVDNTTADYITFIDSDDYLADDKVLFTITEFIKKEEPDYLVSGIVTEVLKDNKLSTIVKQNKETFPWMHGKVYKREFLKQNEIRFHEDVRHLEDSYYTTCILGVVDPKKVAFINYPTVVWTMNKKSLTRSLEPIDYNFKIFEDTFKTPFYTYDYLCKHKASLRLNYFVSSMFGLYIILNSDVFDKDDRKNIKEEYLAKLDAEISKRKNIFILFTKDQLIGLYTNELMELIDRMFLRNIKANFNDFYNKYLEVK